MSAMSVGKFLFSCLKCIFVLNFPDKCLSCCNSCEATYSHSYSIVFSTQGCG
ncbi:hypothetical protein Hanom_Chr02g00103841 [Helianthus anomalus]